MQTQLSRRSGRRSRSRGQVDIPGREMNREEFTQVSQGFLHWAEPLRTGFLVAGEDRRNCEETLPQGLLLIFTGCPLPLCCPWGCSSWMPVEMYGQPLRHASGPIAFIPAPPSFLSFLLGPVVLGFPVTALNQVLLSPLSPANGNASCKGITCSPFLCGITGTLQSTPFRSS